jgi:large conductance mechanosensitive channel protein
MSGFKSFIMRGNLVELAVAVVIGTQFSNLVHQFVSSFVNPLLSLVGRQPLPHAFHHRCRPGRTIHLRRTGA